MVVGLGAVVKLELLTVTDLFVSPRDVLFSTFGTASEVLFSALGTDREVLFSALGAATDVLLTARAAKVVLFSTLGAARDVLFETTGVCTKAVLLVIGTVSTIGIGASSSSSSFDISISNPSGSAFLAASVVLLAAGYTLTCWETDVVFLSTTMFSSRLEDSIWKSVGVCTFF